MRRSVFLAFLILLVLLCSCNKDKQSKSASADIRRGAPIEAGAVAPSFELSNLNSKKVSLEDFKGKLVLLNFWATWCAPCIAEMPSLERIYKKYKSEGLEVVSVSCDSPAAIEDVKAFVKTKGLTFSVLSDPEINVPGRYGVTGFPESFFIGRKGEFLEFKDPSTSKTAVRVVADRPWDSPAFQKQIEKLLKTNT